MQWRFIRMCSSLGHQQPLHCLQYMLFTLKVNASFRAVTVIGPRSSPLLFLVPNVSNTFTPRVQHCTTFSLVLKIFNQFASTTVTICYQIQYRSEALTVSITNITLRLDYNIFSSKLYKTQVPDLIDVSKYRQAPTHVTLNLYTKVCFTLLYVGKA